MDLKAYSFIWLSVSDYSSLSPQITTYYLKSQKTDYFRFKPEGRRRNKIPLLQANSQGSITLVRILKVLLLTFYLLKTDNFRFKPEVRGRGKIL